jgi:two-component system NarL family sensor kinase
LSKGSKRPNSPSSRRKRGGESALGSAPLFDHWQPLPIFQSLLDNLEIGVAHSTLEGKILYANPRFAEILSQAPRRVIGSDIRQFIAVECWKELSEALDRGAENTSEGIMNVLSDDFPDQKVIRLSFSPIPTGVTKTIEIVATEVTQLVEATTALERTQASLHSVSARLLQIQDEERRRLSRELHDSTGQEVSILIMALDKLARDLNGSAGDAGKTARECAERLRKVETQIRTMSYVLHPPLLDDMGLGSAAQWYVDGFTKRTGIEVQSDIPPRMPRFPIEKETAIFRVIQEALTNVYRHSGSRRACVRLIVSPGSIRAIVKDEGKGFAAQRTTASSKSGVGIQSMEGRLEVVGGRLDIVSDDHGTQVIATVPIKEHEYAVGTENASDTGTADAVASIRKRILIADDHQVARQGICTLLSSEPDLEICGEASDGMEALAKTKQLGPDLVILDLSMPKMGGVSAAAHIRRTGPPTKILIYTSHVYPQLETMARAAGCDGYVMKSDATHDLVRAVRTVLGGGTFFRGELAKARSA